MKNKKMVAKELLALAKELLAKGDKVAFDLESMKTQLMEIFQRHKGTQLTAAGITREVGQAGYGIQGADIAAALKDLVKEGKIVRGQHNGKSTFTLK